MNIFNYWRPKHDSFIAPVEMHPLGILEEASGFIDLDSLSAVRVRPLYEGR
jgi:hypothetical protein